MPTSGSSSAPQPEDKEKDADIPRFLTDLSRIAILD